MSAANLFWLLLFAIFALLWWRTKEVQQIARHHIKSYCQEVGVQFLDESVILKSIRLKRTPKGHFALLRKFRFEFATIGDTRYKGEISLLGFKLQGIELEPYRFLPDPKN